MKLADVMPGHSRSKNGVASLAYVPGIHVLNWSVSKGVNGRDKPGHDETQLYVERSHNCPSSVSPPETSTLPGFGSRLSFFTTPSSTSIE